LRGNTPDPPLSGRKPGIGEGREDTKWSGVRERVGEGRYREGGEGRCWEGRSMRHVQLNGFS